MSKSNVLKCHKCFREGRENVNDNEKHGARVIDESVMKIRELVRSDCWSTSG
jgi:hypothetical protein